MGSPLLDAEDKVWASLRKIWSELRGRLREDIRPCRACKRQLRFLKKKRYDKLEATLIEKCKSTGFCLGDEIATETRGLIKFARICPDPLLDDILTLIIRLVYQKGEP